MIDVLTDFNFPRASRAERTSRGLTAAATASSPQHIFACLCKLPVDLASPVSRYRRTLRPLPFPMHWAATQLKNVNTTLLNVLNGGNGIKKHINGRYPILQKAFYGIFS